MPTTSRIATSLLALSLLSAAPLAAEAARYREPETLYRVVDVPGSDALHLRSRPFAYARVVATVPFDARELEATGDRRGQWIEIRTQDENGREVTGWANNRYVAVDERRDGTTYYVIGLTRHDILNVRARPSEGARVKATLPHDATGIAAIDECADGWCQIEARAGWRKVSGYVKQQFLAVTRPSTPYLTGDNGTAGDEELDAADDASGTGSSYNYVDNPRPRFHFWRWLQGRQPDGNGSY